MKTDGTKLEVHLGGAAVEVRCADCLCVRASATRPLTPFRKTASRTAA
jgi:hypothetical protein